MSVDTTFHPLTGTIVVDNTAAQQLKSAGQRGVTVFRIRATKVAGYVAYGPAAPAAAVAPALGGVETSVVGVNFGQTLYLELPPGTFFIGDVALATNGYEITGGMGGVGG